MGSPFAFPCLFMILVVLISSSLYHCHASTQGECLRKWHREKLKSRSKGFVASDLVDTTNLNTEAKVQNFKRDCDLLTQTTGVSNASRQANYLAWGFPGQPNGNFSFAQYSGYVPINANGSKQLFYYFVEASVNSSNAPLILWLNGGPGCSSFGYGAMIELGPWRVNSDGRTLSYNKHSWNKLEAASYIKIKKQKVYENIAIRLSLLWEEVGLEFDGQGHPLKITEYLLFGFTFPDLKIPLIQNTIRTFYRNHKKIVANVLFLDSPAGVGFSYSNITNAPYVLGDTPTTEDSYTFLVNWFQRFPEYRNRKFYIAGESYAGNYIPELANTILTDQANGLVKFINLRGVMLGNALMNYDTDNKGMFTYPWTHGLISDATHKGLISNCINYTPSCDAFYKAFECERGNINVNNIYAPVCHEKGESVRPNSNVPYAIPGYDPCIENYTKHYLNKREVQQALHANPTAWDLCNLDLHSKWNMTDSPDTLLPIYLTMIGKSVKILVYSGDVDSNVPITSTKMALEILNLQVKEQWTAWTSDNEVGGYKVIYEGLTFATIRGSGHEVPLYQPSRMFALVESFLRD